MTNKKLLGWPSFWVLLTLAIPLAFFSCNPDIEEDDMEPADNVITISPGPDAEAQAQAALINADSGQIIRFEAGTYEFTNTLSIDDKNNVRIEGAGRDQTILSFAGQLGGGDGVLATNCTNLLFKDLTVEDAKGDALKARECSFITFYNVGTVWSGEPDSTNGAYGLYPVLCDHVYIEKCYAYGASDAGIYVGQSSQVIVTDSKAEGNVAGIEIENTQFADVYNCEATDNTGGVLIFDLPGLTQYGENVRIYDNNIYENNRTNFAPAGNIVGSVPAGTGVMILSTSDVEVFGNSIANNNFGGAAVISYFLIDQMFDPGSVPGFNPYSTGIYFHSNTFGPMGMVNPEQPETAGLILAILAANMLEHPNLLTDGIFAPFEEADGGLCVEDEGISFINLDAENFFAGMTTDMSAHVCTGTTLTAVDFEPYGL